MNITKMYDLTGRCALVTGGGSGIGKSCAQALAQAGASVVITGRRTQKLEETKKSIEEKGNICQFISADLTLEENCRKAVDFCKNTFGRLDILVNNAGSRGASGTLEEEFSTENLKQTMNTDFVSTFQCIKHAWPECAKNGVGSIINIASLGALRAGAQLAYSAAKGAVKSITKTLAFRLGPRHIRVNTIYPGFIMTEMTQGIKSMPEQEAALRAESPLGLLGQPEDIGLAVVYLASDAARFITGSDLIIDGGAMCR